MVARRGWLLAVDGCILWMAARCGWLLAVNGCDLGQERRRDNSIILLSHDGSYFLDDSPYMIRCTVQWSRPAYSPPDRFWRPTQRLGVTIQSPPDRKKKISRSPLAPGAKRRASEGGGLRPAERGATTKF